MPILDCSIDMLCVYCDSRRAAYTAAVAGNATTMLSTSTRFETCGLHRRCGRQCHLHARHRHVIPDLRPAPSLPRVALALFVIGPRCFATGTVAVAAAPPPCPAPACDFIYISLGMGVHPTIFLVLKHRVCSQPLCRNSVRIPVYEELVTA